MIESVCLHLRPVLTLGRVVVVPFVIFVLFHVCSVLAEVGLPSGLRHTERDRC